ncbi:ACP S-malonyltransferase [Candidatus Njordibacter sp. Uisw_056]|jgi:[acyl-carrier-protein] S-malonyltransferase|uniref:ACP S-malonyltransferase n=1 Tax=Candidatus Njordibacter sp. Uisw_056 TaxID=3230973 RepID=UPI003D47A9CB|tara:strand:- start:996 stop:1928 length:933 start_codon:yes stop_codon:yes gene_type:complete
MSANIAFVFPGQGSQSVGMLAELGANHHVVVETFSQASEALGYDLWQLVQHDQSGQLNQTYITQPALLSASVALWRLWLEKGGRTPTMLAGHSLGEYSALVCAGALGFSDAIRLVEARGQFMQAAVPSGEGAMAAIIGLDNDAIALACEVSAQGQTVAPVNYNSPGQVVIAGSKLAVERAMVACKAGGAKRALALPVSVPSHCALMLPAAEKLRTILAGVKMSLPMIPVVHNVDAKLASSSEAIISNLVAQLHQPVLWTQCVESIAASGVDLVVECGPGKVLNGLTKRINKTLQSASINDAASLAATLKL